MTYYENLLKEQVMQALLGNTTVTLKGYVGKLISENTADQQKILQAYQLISNEIYGIAPATF